MTRTARQKALRTRERERQKQQPRAKCPTPYKDAHTQATAINAAMHRSSIAGAPMRPYKCKCKRWHITSKEVA